MRRQWGLEPLQAQNLIPQFTELIFGGIFA
jgi:hypothetical protein